jgi:hypothetical protein
VDLTVFISPTRTYILKSQGCDPNPQKLKKFLSKKIFDRGKIQSCYLSPRTAGAWRHYATVKQAAGSFVADTRFKTRGAPHVTANVC